MSRLLVAILCFGIVTIAGADEFVMTQRSTDAIANSAALPHKGQTMQAVSRQFGAPQVRHAAVGGETPRHPPITRWDYAGFSVFFEHAHVVDAVIPDQPPPVYHSEQLQAASP